jgi:hypothetical protein
MMLLLNWHQKAWSQTIDYRYHSMFIYQFSNYIEWPGNSSKKEFFIGVFDNQQIVGNVRRATENKTIQNKKVVVASLDDDNLDLLKYMDIVFIPEVNSAKIRKIIQETRNLPVVVVTEREGAISMGSHINFILNNERLRFEINNAELKKRNFKVSNDLLKLASFVK